jgi:hypothetical protein
MDALALLLSRLQFAFTISFHIIFPSFTIGLAAWLAVLEGLYLRTGHVRARAENGRPARSDVAGARDGRRRPPARQRGVLLGPGEIQWRFLPLGSGRARHCPLRRHRFRLPIVCPDLRPCQPFVR